jgi:uncharacterized protein involved in type VI secretion and phage assembly
VLGVARRQGAGAEASLRPRFQTPGNLCSVRGGGAAETGLRRVDSEARVGEGGRIGGDAEAKRLGRWRRAARRRNHARVGSSGYWVYADCEV